MEKILKKKEKQCVMHVGGADENFGDSVYPIVISFY